MCLALWIFLLPVATHGHEASPERNLHFTQLNFPPHPHHSQGHHAQLCRPPPEDALFSLHKRSSSRHHNSRVGICHLRRHLWFSDHLKQNKTVPFVQNLDVWDRVSKAYQFQKLNQKTSTITHSLNSSTSSGACWGVMLQGFKKYARTFDNKQELMAYAKSLYNEILYNAHIL